MRQLLGDPVGVDPHQLQAVVLERSQPALGVSPCVGRAGEQNDTSSRGICPSRASIVLRKSVAPTVAEHGSRADEGRARGRRPQVEGTAPADAAVGLRTWSVVWHSTSRDGRWQDGLEPGASSVRILDIQRQRERLRSVRRQPGEGARDDQRRARFDGLRQRQALQRKIRARHRRRSEARDLDPPPGQTRESGPRIVSGRPPVSEDRHPPAGHLGQGSFGDRERAGQARFEAGLRRSCAPRAARELLEELLRRIGTVDAFDVGGEAQHEQLFACSCRLAHLALELAARPTAPADARAYDARRRIDQNHAQRVALRSLARVGTGHEHPGRERAQENAQRSETRGGAGTPRHRAPLASSRRSAQRDGTPVRDRCVEAIHPPPSRRSST